MRKPLLFLIVILCHASLLGQNSAGRSNTFFLSYSASGLGGNVFDSFRVFCVERDSFVLSQEEPFFPEGFFKSNGGSTILSSGLLRSSSIDSIKAIVKLVEPEKVFKFNSCIQSGEARLLTIVIDNKFWEFDLMNTFDRTTIAILRVLNTYLEKRHRFYVDDQPMKKEENCR